MTTSKTSRTRSAHAPTALRDALSRIDSLTKQLIAMADELGCCRIIIEEAAATIQRLNYLDPLTLLANRRRLFEFAECELERARDLGLPFCVAMLDIDNFKACVNDRFGHTTGDFCLRTTGRICSALVRDELDLVARYGGEEICIVLPGLDEPQAALVAERIRRKIAAYRRRSDGCRWTVTIGLGGSSSGTTFSEMIEVADRALYAGKNAGKNKVIVASTTTGFLGSGVKVNTLAAA